MTQFSDDKKLIAFLKQYAPLPPPSAINLEERVMAQVTQGERIPQRRRLRLSWLVPSLIAAGLFLLWGEQQHLQPTPPLATTPDELEAFFIESWSGVSEDSALESATYFPVLDWQVLSDVETEPKSSNP